MQVERAGAAQGAYRLVLVVGLLLVLAANLPGHMTLDSVIQLTEGRTGEYVSFNPRLMSWLLARFDAVLPGTSLFVTFNTALLFASLWAVPRLTGKVSWLAVPVAALVIATPQVLIYQGIVWKDVFFANLAVTAFVCLALAAGEPDRLRRILALATAVVLLAVASQVRQNGLLVVVMAALGFGLALRNASAGARLRLGLVVLAAPLALGWAATASIKPSSGAPAFQDGLRVLLHYDILGAAAADPQLPLRALETVDPELDDRVRADAARHYSPERVDTLDQGRSLVELWALPFDTVRRQWAEILTESPLAYLEHRLAAFQQVLLTPEIRACLPIAIGVDADPARLAALEIPAAQDRQDRALYAYAARFFETPVFSHLAYAVLAAAVAVGLMVRRTGADWIVAALMAAALGFTASYVVISLACDYRYLYFLDLAALFGLVYLAARPTLRRGAAAQ